MKTDVIEKYYDTVLSLGIGGSQKKFYEMVKSSMKHIEITPLSELPEMLRYYVQKIVSSENIEPKECYKNSATFTADAFVRMPYRYFVGYCEGMLVDNHLPIPIEHAWNCIYDKHEDKMYYIDLTFEFVIGELGKDYAIIKEYDAQDVSKMMMKYQTYGSWYQNEFISQIKKEESYETVK